MKIKWRENMLAKTLAFLLAVAAFTAAAAMAWYQLANFSALWDNDYSGGSSGYTRRYLVAQDKGMVTYLIDLKEMDAAGQELSLATRRQLEQLEAEYDAGATNLRWQLLDKEGNIIYGNTQEDSSKVGWDRWESYTRYAKRDGYVSNIQWENWDEDNLSYPNAVNRDDYSESVCNDRWREALAELVEQARQFPDREGYSTEDQSYGAPADAVLCDDDTYTSVLLVTSLDNELFVYPPTIRACLKPNRFGFIFDPDDLEWMIDPDFAPTGEDASGLETAVKPQSSPETATLVLWVDSALRVDDQYRMAAVRLQEWQSGRAEYLFVTITLSTAGLLLLLYLCCGAGHKRGAEGIDLNWFHRIPGDVLLCVMAAGGVSAVFVGIDMTINSYMYIPMYMQLLYIGIAVAFAAALSMGALITVCARCKAHTLLRNTLTWKLCAGLWRLFLWSWYKVGELFGALGRAIQAVPLIWKAVMSCMVYAMFTFWMITSWRYYSSGILILWLIVTFLAACYLCTWAYQWKRIRHGTQEIIGGNPDYHIDTRRMLPDLRGHADELNNLGHAISTAVDQRVKSEHFKAELITNVSHDLKTPLTSIINYVDLLKKEDIDNPKAQEYIEVLDRKSQRLKKLTEDLVEASKASTGSLSVSWERLDWAQLTDQALAECGERLESQKLTVVRSLPERPVWVEADGRHLWRVLDNLLTNCAKYAMPGTRVYVDLRQAGERAVLSVKNISRDALDVPAERLMERFVRGDESRNTSGSGLGLSIAQSLTELQHGTFEISIDGDLFKAVVALPLAGDSPSDPISLIL